MALIKEGLSRLVVTVVRGAADVAQKLAGGFDAQCSPYHLNAWFCGAKGVVTQGVRVREREDYLNRWRRNSSSLLCVDHTVLLSLEVFGPLRVGIPVFYH